MCIHIKAHFWVFKDGLKTRTEESICIRNAQNYFPKECGGENTKLNDVKNESNLKLTLTISSVLSLVKMIPMRSGLTILKPLYVHTRTEQLSKWMADGEH